MKKPERWDLQPDQLLDDWLWSIDYLSYCPYESSKAEVIHDIKCNTPPLSSDNGRVLAAVWQKETDENYTRRVLALVAQLDEQAAILKQQLCN
ncbi:MAG: hypothetical protein EBU46_00135 [Nitrosomonadaceae bacterium]|nr:hypothetical protein [Nitrosomonadaceae bacterium]